VLEYLPSPLGRLCTSTVDDTIDCARTCRAAVPEPPLDEHPAATTATTSAIPPTCHVRPMDLSPVCPIPRDERDRTARRDPPFAGGSRAFLTGRLLGGDLQDGRAAHRVRRDREQRLVGLLERVGRERRVEVRLGGEGEELLRVPAGEVRDRAQRPFTPQ